LHPHCQYRRHGVFFGSLAVSGRRRGSGIASAMSGGEQPELMGEFQSRLARNTKLPSLAGIGRRLALNQVRP
jgi:hypothetical protein